MSTAFPWGWPFFHLTKRRPGTEPRQDPAPHPDNVNPDEVPQQRQCPTCGQSVPDEFGAGAGAPLHYYVQTDIDGDHVLADPDWAGICGRCGGRTMHTVSPGKMHCSRCD